jgi:hypothetical protein
MFTETDLAQTIVTYLDCYDLGVTVLDPKELPIPTTRVKFRYVTGEEFIAIIVQVGTVTQARTL